MNILFVDQFSEWGGAQLCVRDLIVEGLRRGWGVHVMAPAGPLVDFCRLQGICAETLTPGHYANGRKTVSDLLRFVPDTFRRALAVRHAVRQGAIHLVVANGPRILPATVFAGCPVVYYAHSSPGKRYARWIVSWFARRKGTTVIAVSRFVAKFIKTSTTRVIYNGVKDQGFRVRPTNRGSLRVGIIGRIAAEKGQVDFVQAAGVIVAAHPNARFVVIGTALYSSAAYERTVRRLAQDLPVEFPGWTRDIASTLHNLDILAVPSSSVEAATRVILEAHSAGTPVVGYPSGGIPELVENGETGILTASADYRSLAETIQRLLSDPESMGRLSCNARRQWETRFRLERFLAEACDLFEQAGAVRGAPPAEGAAREAGQRAQMVTDTPHK